jgi:hypothetical protein
MLRIAEFDVLASATGALYRARVYGDPASTRWDGYVVFFPIVGGAVISTPRETTQPTFESLRHWAFALDVVYLEGALRRALAAGSGVPMPPITESDLAAAELTAADDAIALHRAANRAGVEAASELASAETHEQAAAAARKNAERLARSQEDLDTLANETARSAAEAAADVYESAAREARNVATDLGSATKSKVGTSRKRSTPQKKRR